MPANKLKKGDTVILVSPARSVTLNTIQPFINRLKNWGLHVILSKHIFAVDHRFAGSKRERTEDFQTALDHRWAKAIICTCGGYGSIQLIDSLDFSTFIKYPKWIVGFSDITIFHAHVNQLYDLPTVHAIMAFSFNRATVQSYTSLKKALFGESYSITIATKKQVKRTIKGKIIGGNLSIIYSLLGSRSSINPTGKILFIEDIDEYLYHLERMMISLKRNGFFNRIKALLVGGMTDIQDNKIPFGKNIEQIVQEVCGEYDFPIIFNLPVGHLNDNRALIFNQECELTIEQTQTKIRFN